jgi:hypothetical protein
MKVEELVEPDVSDEMQKAVEKGEEAKHSAKPDQGLPSCDSSKRRDAQRNHHKTQCPDTGPVPQVFNGICAQLAGESIPRQPDRRHKTEQKDGRLEYPPTINFGDHRRKFIAVRSFIDLVHCICKRPVTKTAVRTPTETIASVEDQIDLTGGAQRPGS